MTCSKCKCTSFKSFDWDYHACTNCGTLVEVVKTEIIQHKQFNKKYPNSELHKEIRAYMVKHYDKIAMLRAQETLWKDIISSMSIQWSKSTVTAHFKAVQESKTVLT